MACFITHNDDIASELLNHFNGDLDEAKNALEHNYQGCYQSVEEFAQEITEETTEIPEHLAFYIDYEKLARDMEFSGDIYSVRQSYNQVHVFWSA